MLKATMAGQLETNLQDSLKQTPSRPIYSIPSCQLLELAPCGKEKRGERKICNSFCCPVKKFSRIWQTIKTCTKPLCPRLPLSFPPPSFACLPSPAQPECRAGMLFCLIKQQQLGKHIFKRFSHSQACRSLGKGWLQH